MLLDLQNSIENFQAGPALAELARNIVAADPEFAMGEYYLSAVIPPGEATSHLEKAVALSKKASEGERRFIEAMSIVRSNGGANLQEAIPSLEKLADDYPEERLVFMLLGQIYQATNQSDKARAAFERALEIGPPSARARAFLANDDLLRGKYSKARETFDAVAKDLPDGTAPFAIRYGVAYSYLYEGDAESAVNALETYLREYRASGAAQAFPEVFIWNSIARVYLENGQPSEALEAYEKGYETVPPSSIAEDQKQLWQGRFIHGKCRSLAKMGKHEDAQTCSLKVRKLIDAGGETAKQYLPAYHYLAGYLKLESGDLDEALEHLKQANANDPFQKLLLARTYEKKGDKENARKTYEEIVASTNNGLERALAYAEAKSKLSTL